MKEVNEVEIKATPLLTGRGLCDTCQHLVGTKECAVRAKASRFLAHGQAVQTCSQYYGRGGRRAVSE